MNTLSVSEFKKHCTRELRELAHTGEPILITSRSRPIARVEPIVSRGKHPAWGALAGQVLSMADDFDEPLGDEAWEAAD